MEEIKISKLSDYVKFIEENCDACDVLYRGQSVDMPLLPKLARQGIKLIDPILKAEKDIFDEFKRRSLPYLDTIPANSWDWLSLAQHHGLLTRLLDWTGNPLVALWFVVKDAPNASGNGVVWVFHVKKADYADPECDDPFIGGKTKVFLPRDISPRIITQDAIFTVHKYIEKKQRFIPLDRNVLYKKALQKITISSSLFSEIRYDLDKCSINSFTMFPDMDGLSKYIEWCNAKYSDEV